MQPDKLTTEPTEYYKPANESATILSGDIPSEEPIDGLLSGIKEAVTEAPSIRIDGITTNVKGRILGVPFDLKLGGNGSRNIRRDRKRCGMPRMRVQKRGRGAEGMKPCL